LININQVGANTIDMNMYDTISLGNWHIARTWDII